MTDLLKTPYALWSQTTYAKNRRTAPELILEMCLQANQLIESAKAIKENARRLWAKALGLHSNKTIVAWEENKQNCKGVFISIHETEEPFSEAPKITVSVLKEGKPYGRRVIRNWKIIT